MYLITFQFLYFPWNCSRQRYLLKITKIDRENNSHNINKFIANLPQEWDLNIGSNDVNKCYDNFLETLQV